MKLYIQEVNLGLPLLKSTKNVATIFGNNFSVAWCKFLNPKSIPVCNQVLTYIQKVIIVICAKYVVIFRISCLLTILREAKGNFKMSSR